MAAHLGMVMLLLITIIAVEEDIYGATVRITYYWVETFSNTIMAVILYFTNVNRKKDRKKKGPRRRIRNTGQLPTEKQVPHLTSDSHIIETRKSMRF